MPSLYSRARKSLGLGPSSSERALALAAENKRLKFKARAAKAEASGVGINFGQFDYEANLAMRGTKKWTTLDAMENDPHIKDQLRVSILPLVNGDWSMEPASDSPKDTEIAEFVGANLYRIPSEKFGRQYWCRSAWKAQRLPEVLRCKRDGFSLFHRTMRVESGKWVFDRLTWLEPESVDPRGWKMDETDDLIEVKRSYSDAADHYKTLEPIAADELALYACEFIGSRYEGRPFVRAMYGAFIRKEAILRNSVIWAQKAGAPTPMGLYPRDWVNDSELVDRFEEYVMQTRGESPAEAFGVFPKGEDGNDPEIRWAAADAGELDRSRGLIDGENAEIAAGGGNKARSLVGAPHGSRALGDSLSPVDLQLIEADVEVLREQETHGIGNLAGNIETLVAVNYGTNVDLPKLVCSKIDPHEKMNRIEGTISASGAGLVPSHELIRKQVTEDLGYSLPDDAYEIQEPVAPPPGAGQEPGTPADGPRAIPDEDEETEEDVAAAALAAASELESFKARIAPHLQQEDASRKGGTFRGKTKLEARLLNLAAISEAQRVGDRDALAVLRTTQSAMVRDLMGRLKRGKVTPRNLGSLRRSKFRQEKKATAELERSLGNTGRTGAGHVDAELKRADN